MRAWKWFIYFPGDAYALGPVHFSEREYKKAPNAAEVRAWARDWDKLKRLPAGFACWPAK